MKTYSPIDGLARMVKGAAVALVNGEIGEIVRVVGWPSERHIRLSVARFLQGKLSERSGG